MRTDRRGFIAALAALPVVGRLLQKRGLGADYLSDWKAWQDASMPPPMIFRGATHVDIYRGTLGNRPLFQERITIAEAKRRGYLSHMRGSNVR